MAPPAMAPPLFSDHYPGGSHPRSDHTPRKDPPTSKANLGPLNTVRHGRRF